MTTREPTGAAFMLRCAEFGLSDLALSQMTIGMIYDMLTEKANDNVEYPYKATADDVKTFFGG